MKKTLLDRTISRRSVLKGGAAIAGATAITGFPMVWAQNLKDVTLNHTGMSYSTLPRHRQAGEPGPWLQGRDVGGRSSGPAEPHRAGSDFDRHRRHEIWQSKVAVPQGAPRRSTSPRSRTGTR